SRTSPSSATITSLSGSARPTVPNRGALAGLSVAVAQLSVMPYPSSTSTPQASKNSSSSRSIGAAPTSASFRRSPKRERTFARPTRSATRSRAAVSGPPLLPARSAHRARPGHVVSRLGFGHLVEDPRRISAPVDESSAYVDDDRLGEASQHVCQRQEHVDDRLDVVKFELPAVHRGGREEVGVGEHASLRRSRGP